MLWRTLLLISVSILGPDANAEPLNLFMPKTEMRPMSGYAEFLNLSPAFHVWQNDPKLSAYDTQIFPDGSGVTDLCIPAAMADLLLYQRTDRGPAIKSLMIPGIYSELNSSKTTVIEGAEIVKSLLHTCQFSPRTLQNPESGINWVSGAQCLKKIYAQSGIEQADIQYIRPGLTEEEGIVTQGRAPTLSDIRNSLNAGFEVIAIIAQVKNDAKRGISQIVNTHAVNVFGYSAKTNSSNSSLVLYLQNSNRHYSMNFIDPVFDTAQLTLNSGESLIPEKISPIEISTLQGRLLNFEGTRTFLAGLVLVRIK